jgi:hypothetical protein
MLGSSDAVDSLPLPPPLPSSPTPLLSVSSPSPVLLPPRSHTHSQSAPGGLGEGVCHHIPSFNSLTPENASIHSPDRPPALSGGAVVHGGRRRAAEPLFAAAGLPVLGRLALPSRSSRSSRSSGRRGVAALRRPLLRRPPRRGPAARARDELRGAP